MYCVFLLLLSGFSVGANIGATSATAAALLSKLDAADLIVTIVSPHFVDNHDLVAGLQVAINRHLYCKGRTLLQATLLNILYNQLIIMLLINELLYIIYA